MYSYLDPTTLLRQRAQEIDRTVANRQIDRAMAARRESRSTLQHRVSGRPIQRLVKQLRAT